MRAYGEVVVGYLVFGVALNYTGGGKFFNDLAFALVGRMRGGAAQVGVISSALQGSISGSVISNVITSGVVTIPAMKRTGFRADYAGGVEAVASTGAVLMPPVMGSTAFVMASFLGKPYGEIALAATVPGLLFYFALMVQIDAYAARLGLSGMKREELPRVGAVMREGWYFHPGLRRARDVHAGGAAGGAGAVLRHRDPARDQSDPAAASDGLAAIRGVSWRRRAASLAELAALLLGVGFLIGALLMTGLAGTLANDLVYLAGGAPLMLLIMGAITSFIFGLGLTVTACYIFLAIVLAPPLIKAGLDPLAIHMFVLYWGMVSFITPPVALAAFAAAPIAKTSQTKIGIQAMRLGTAIYVIPFCFVLNPALLLKGDPFVVAVSIVFAFIGIALAASALQGYVDPDRPHPQYPRGLGRARVAAGEARSISRSRSNASSGCRCRRPFRPDSRLRPRASDCSTSSTKNQGGFRYENAHRCDGHRICDPGRPRPCRLRRNKAPNCLRR